MVAPRTVAILFSALFLLALVPTDIAAIQIDSDLTTTVDVAGDGPYIFSIVSDGGSRLLIDGVVVINDDGKPGNAFRLMDHVEVLKLVPAGEQRSDAGMDHR